MVVQFLFLVFNLIVVEFQVRHHSNIKHYDFVTL